MSGHKRTTVTISQEEYRRLYENEMLLKGLSHPEEDTESTSFSQVSLEYLTEQMNQVLQRQENFIRLGEQLRGHISEIELHTANQIRDFELKVLEEIQHTQKYSQQYIDQVQKQIEDIENLLVQNHIEFQNQLSILRNQNEIYSRDNQDKYFYAYDWLNDCIYLFNFVLQNYPESLPYIKELEFYQFQIEQAVQNLSSGFYDASLSISQNVYFPLSQLRIHLENEGIEKRKLIATYLDNLRELISFIDENKFITPVDIHGNFIDTVISVDEWTGNSLSHLEENIFSLVSELENKGTEYSLHQIREVIGNQIKEFTKDIPEILQKARINALNSHLNYLIANDVLLSLIEQGYKPVEGNYEDRSYHTYIAKAMDPLGNIVEIKVDTENPEKIEHSLHIVSMNEQSHSLHELRQRAKEIQRSLNRLGWVVQEPVEIPKKENQPSISLHKTRTIPVGKINP